MSLNNIVTIEQIKNAMGIRHLFTSDRQSLGLSLFFEDYPPRAEVKKKAKKSKRKK